MAGFMAGFGNTFAGLIESDREYYREAASKRRDYIQTYGTKAVVERENEANAALATINNLQTAGIDKDALRYVLDTSGVSGIAELANTIKSRDDLTPDQISRMVEVSKDYVATNPDEDINTVVKRAYGLYKATDDPVKREGNIMSAVLGLDSRMMEDDVLNDLYVNGFSGRDIYRIMGSGSPKPGAALELNLPTKRPGMQELNAAALSVSNKFETSIDAAIDSAIRSNNTGLQKELQALKGRGVEGMADYATKYDSSLMDFARIVETSNPGSISGNSINLGTFPTAFTNYWEEQKDDAIMAGGESPTVDEEALAEQAKNAKVGDTIVLDGRPYKVTGKGADGKPNLSPVTAFEAEESVVQEGGTEEPVVAEVVEPVVEDPIIKIGKQLLDGKDGSMFDYTRAYKEIMDLDEDQRSAYVQTFNALEDVTSFSDVAKSIAAATPGIADSAAGIGMGAMVIGGNAITTGLAKAYNLMTGDRSTAAGLLADNPRRRAEAEKLIANGAASYLEDAIEKLELEKGDDEGLFQFSGFGQNNPDRERSIETQLLGSGKLGVFVDRLVGELSKASATQGLDTAEGRIADLDKQFLADEEGFPQPAPRRYAPSTEQRLETPERRANAARDQRVASEVNRRELTESATRIADMLSRPSSEVSQEELTNFVMEVQAKFGEEAVRAELKRIVQASQ